VVSFAANSQWSNADHNAHVDGNVKVYSPTQFEFPVGHDNVFQPLAISAASGVSFLSLDYRHLAHSDLNPSSGLIKIHPAHYWSLNQGSGTAKVHLSWNAFSNLDTFLNGLTLEDLTVVGYKNNAWELIPSALENNTSNSLLSGAIVSETPIALNEYNALALAVKGIAGPDGTPAGLPLVAEGVSPNGDGDNDTWFIQGIERFPNAQIKVYNRTGEVVFQANNGYNNDWIGDFKNSGNILPSAPYFYTIDLDNDGELDLQGWLYVQQ
jgi:gliding motility-associated-like protein